MKISWPRAFTGLQRFSAGLLSLSVLFLLIEFFDELVFGVQGAALPAIRQDLGLTYGQIGLFLGLPSIIGTLVEPAIMLLGDTPLRKALVLAGGIGFGVAMLLTAGAQAFWPLLLAAFLTFPSSGAFVSLSQATLMDLNPGREPHSMARWAVAGSLGSLGGPLLLAGGFALGLNWRWAYLSLAVMAAGLLLLAWPQAFPARRLPEDEHDIGFGRLLKGLGTALRTPRLLRWLFLMETADLLLDIFTGYAALYFADVSHATPAQVSLLLTLLTGAGLAGDLLLIPLLERVSGRGWVRWSALAALLLYPAWLLAPGLPAKAVLLVAVRLATTGWYAVLQGEAYASLPGQSGTVSAVSSLTNLLDGLLAWLIGWVAGSAGLTAAMWLLLAGPLCLAVFVPSKQK